MNTENTLNRTPVRQMAGEIASILKKEKPDYDYLRELFRHLRKELAVRVVRKSKKLPYIPSDDEIKAFHETVWKTRNVRNLIIFKTFLYTGIRVGELVKIRIDDVDLDRCRIRIRDGRENREERFVPYPEPFGLALAVHARAMRKDGAEFLFESNRKKPYAERGIRRVFETYSEKAGLKHPISPQRLRHFLMAWMKKQGMEDAKLMTFSGHAGRQSLDIYSKWAKEQAKEEYDEAIKKFPV
jgi:integrase/recombinase XerD